jgi:hypothetical protein
MAGVQALAFAELLAGGLFLTSAIENEPVSEIIKRGLQGAKIPTAGAGAGSTANASLESSAPAGGTDAPAPGIAASEALSAPTLSSEKEIRTLEKVVRGEHPHWTQWQINERIAAVYDDVHGVKGK